MSGRKKAKKAKMVEKITHFCRYYCGFGTQSVSELFAHVESGVCRFPSVNPPPSATPLSSNNNIDEVRVDVDMEDVIVLGDIENRDLNCGEDKENKRDESKSTIEPPMPASSSSTSSRPIVKYSNDEEVHKARFNVIEFLDNEPMPGEREDYDPKLKELLKPARASYPRGIEFESGRGFFRLTPDETCKSGFAKTSLQAILRREWKGAMSQSSKEYRKTPQRKKIVAAARDKYRAVSDRISNFYIFVAFPKASVDETKLKPLDKEYILNLLVDPEIPKKIYPGVYLSHEGEVTMRLTHFSPSNSHTPIYQLLATGNYVGFQVLVVPCFSQYSSGQGEAFIMEFGKEWNEKKGPSEFILTETAPLNDEEVLGYDEDGTVLSYPDRAKQLASEGVWPFAKLDEESDPSPSNGAKSAELYQLPYFIKPSYIIRRGITGLGQGKNYVKQY